MRARRAAFDISRPLNLDVRRRTMSHVINAIRVPTFLLAFALILPVSAQTHVALPPSIFKTQMLGYPAPARRLNQQGRILVEFSISPTGQLTDAELIAAEPQGFFGTARLEELRRWRFDVPSDWESSGGNRQRFRLSVVFALKPCPGGPNCVAPVAYDADLKVTISAGSIPEPH